MRKIFSFLLVLALLVGGGVYLSKNKKSVLAYDKTVCAGHLVQGDPCLNDFYVKLVSQYDQKVAIDDLKRRYNESPFVAGDCHPLMHTIGAEASKKYATVSEAYLHGDVFCWNGYYHGVMEGIVGRIGEANVTAQINTICADIKGRESYSFDYFNCVHGLGHGVMELKEDQLFDALKICDGLNGEWEQESCQGGVFMENVIVFYHYGHSDYLKKDDLLYPCDTVENKYKGSCYLNQSSYVLQASNYNFKPVSDLCTTVSQPWRDICFQSMGRDAGNQALHDDLRTKNLCYLPTDENDRKNCIVGAIKEFVTFHQSFKDSQSFCQSLTPEEKALCLSTGEQYYSIF